MEQQLLIKNKDFAQNPYKIDNEIVKQDMDDLGLSNSNLERKNIKYTIYNAKKKYNEERLLKTGFQILK